MQLTYEDYTREELDEQYRNVRAIQFQVELRTGKSGDWIARQEDCKLLPANPWYGWAFIVDRECILIPNADVMHDPKDAVFIDRLATEVLGYPPDSLEHLRQMKDDNRHRIEALRTEIKKLQNQHDGLMKYEVELLGRIGVLEHGV